MSELVVRRRHFARTTVSESIPKDQAHIERDIPEV